LRSLFPALALAALLLAAWQLLASLTGFFAVSSPLAATTRLMELAQTPNFWADVRETFTAFALAFVIAVSAGVTLGVVLGLNRFSGDTLEPILVNFYSLPKVTLYPLVLLVFGLGMSARVAFGVMHGLVPITLVTRNAIRQVRPVYWQTARSLRMSYPASVVYLVIPAILPELMAGVRIGFALSLLGVIIGEMFASHRGLGFSAVNAMNLGDMNAIMAIGMSLAIFAVLANSLMLALERRMRHQSAAR
jgi:NitT/TauT family transport system permease protein